MEESRVKLVENKKNLSQFYSTLFYSPPSSSIQTNQYDFREFTCLGQTCCKIQSERLLMLHKDNYVQNATHFCVLIFSPHFSPIWGECILAGLRIKYLGPISFHSPFLSQQNNTKSDFLFPFFHHLPNLLNQTKY